jgi:hypothetical protein
MDKGISDIAIMHGSNLFKAIDDAVFRNFLVRMNDIQPFYAVSFNDEKNLVISDDFLEIMDRVVINPLFENYSEMDYRHIELIAQDDDPLKHWTNLRSAFSTMDGELLRFILAMNIPLEKFIRYELASRGHDENHKWVGFEKAREIWINT